MSPTVAALASWQVRPGVLLVLLVTALLYLRGWRRLRAEVPQHFGPGQLAAFAGGLAAVAVAVASPLDVFAGLLLQVHMAQHLLLTMVAPPLLWLGNPAIPLLRGVPRRWASDGLGPFLRWPVLHVALRGIAAPPVAWLLFTATILAWHLPGPYQLALRSPAWHAAEHAAFLASALLFWWPVVQPWPSQPQWPRWTMVPYLLLADVVNTALAAFFIFSERLVYPVYATAPRLFGISALGDQSTAGALMWVPGSVAYLVPAAAVSIALLSPLRQTHTRRSSGARLALGTVGTAWPAGARPQGARAAPFDLLRVPVLGSALRSPGTRRIVQIAMLGAAAAVVVDGIAGPQMAPMNLAGVLPWTYWRPLAIAALLLAGNAVCFACPFTLPRALARAVGGARHIWPRWLRAKWAGAALLIIYLWSYEVYAPWDSPRWTATVVLAYFAAAFAVDALFRGAAFCKYVCPIGQFQFVGSLASPLTVAARDPAICRTCATHDCIRGSATRRGCELELFLPEKRGNLDCTFCLDCVAACPHDNAGVLAAAPARALARDRRGASIGRLSERPDVAVIALIVVGAAFMNAAAMVEPVAGWLSLDAMGLPMLMALVTLPIALARVSAWTARRLSGTAMPVAALTSRFAPALIPLGLAMWGAHFAFHLATAGGMLVPVAQRVASDLGRAVLGAPAWAARGPMSGCGDVLALELTILGIGLLAALRALWRIAAHDHGRSPAALRLAAPWAALTIALWFAGVWILLQPMAMRGAMAH